MNGKDNELRMYVLIEIAIITIKSVMNIME